MVWMRPPALVEGEAISPVQRLLACADSASGVSAALDVSEWAFLNTELTVHVLRPPAGEWVCLDAATTLGSGAVGVAGAAAYDVIGLVARSSQALLVAPRGPRVGAVCPYAAAESAHFAPGLWVTCADSGWFWGETAPTRACSRVKTSPGQSWKRRQGRASSSS